MRTQRYVVLILSFFLTLSNQSTTLQAEHIVDDDEGIEEVLELPLDEGLLSDLKEHEEIIEEVLENPIDKDLLDESKFHEEIKKDILKDYTSEAIFTETKLTDDIDTVEKLNLAIRDAESGSEIVLSKNFMQEDFELQIPNKIISINGENLLWNTGSIKITGNDATGNLILKNFKIDAENILKKVFMIEHRSGNLEFENVEIFKSSVGAIHIGSVQDAKTILKRVYIHDNKSVNTAPAISLGSTANLEIEHSTFENNIGMGGGYEVGAISSKWFSGVLEIKSSVFRNNRNESINTGVTGGGGGAMSFHFMQGDILINNSIFDKNETSGRNTPVKSTYDGGAIYIFDGRGHPSGRDSTFIVNGTTFSNNIAYDDGGAILLQGTGNPGFTTSINNSTFFNNHAYGLDGANHSGGAIQYFKNGGSSRMSNSITASTFVMNTAGSELSQVEQRGGAIGLSGAGLFATAALTRVNNLMIGNQVYDAKGHINEKSRYKDISNFTTVQDGKLNIINVDGGETPLTSLKTLTGSDVVLLRDNYSSIKAGVHDEIVQTIPMIPEVISDNSFEDSPKLLSDQRGYPRYKDHGAIEQSWIKYNAESDYFALEPLNEFDGTLYYRLSKDGSEEDYRIAEYYDLGAIGRSSRVKSAEDLSFVKKGYTLQGWSSHKEHNNIVEYGIGDKIIFNEENISLYPIWTKDMVYYTVTYTDGVDDEEIFNDEVYTIKEGSNTPSFNTEISREGYAFIGWSPKLSETVTKDVIYVAQWKIKTYTLDFESNGGSFIPAQEVEYLESFSAPQDPLKDGFMFMGWYKSDRLDVPFDFNERVTENKIAYAKWEKIQNPQRPKSPNPENKTPETGVFIKNETLLITMSLLSILLVISLKSKKLR